MDGEERGKRDTVMRMGVRVSQVPSSGQGRGDTVSHTTFSENPEDNRGLVVGAAGRLKARTQGELSLAGAWNRPECATQGRAFWEAGD